MKCPFPLNTLKGDTEMMKASLFALILFATPAAGEFYIDLGVTYVDKLEIKEQASITFGDFTVSAERSASLEVKELVPMVRVGYMWKNYGLELDYAGYSSANIKRINLYHRFSFK